MEMSEIALWASIVLIPIAIMVSIKRVYELGRKNGRKEIEREYRHRMR